MQPQIESDTKTIKKTTASLNSLGRWMSTLTGLDKENFITLVNLPTFWDLAAKMPEGEYKKMACIARFVVESKQQNG